MPLAILKLASLDGFTKTTSEKYGEQLTLTTNGVSGSRPTILVAGPDGALFNLSLGSHQGEDGVWAPVVRLKAVPNVRTAPVQKAKGPAQAAPAQPAAPGITDTLNAIMGALGSIGSRLEALEKPKAKASAKAAVVTP